MATYSTGISVTWDGVEFSEVTSLSVSGGGERQGRSVNWSPNQVSIGLSCLGTANINVSQIGELKTLEVSGGGISFSGYAICTDVAAQPQLNGVTQFSMSFRSIN
jgi:hypothetical protein